MSQPPHNPGPKARMVSIPEAAAALKVSPQMLRRWCRDGAPHQKRDGRAYVDVATIATWRETYRTGHVEGMHGGGRANAGRPPRKRARAQKPAPAAPQAPAPTTPSAPAAPPPQNAAPAIPTMGPIPTNLKDLTQLLQSGDISVTKMETMRKAVQTILALEERERERGGLVKAAEVQSVFEAALGHMRTALERLGPDLAAWAASEFRLNGTQAAALRQQALRRVDGAVAQMLRIFEEDKERETHAKNT